MRKSVVLVLSLASTVALAADTKKPAAAPAGKPMEMPKPPPEVEAGLKYFEGVWTCTGTHHAMQAMPEFKFTNKASAWFDLKGWWMQLRIDQEVGPMKGDEVFEGFQTYDPTTKKYVMWGFSMGMTAPAMGVSSGWEGDKMVSAGEGMFMGKKVSMRDVFIKKSPTEMSVTLERGEPGKMMVVSEETCKKTAEKPAKKP